MADHGIAHAAGAAVGTWFFMFIPMFFAAAAAFETDTVWWSWPLMVLAALACGAFAWHMRSRNPIVSAGVWVGVALGLIHAGLCFSGS
ncbi:MAG: hypothetical protein M3478_07255 [Planctomycetota bacterium]|nr:hypothetical protein [Acidobacteriota bacterium]MDQ3440132.1 hypothetical protein [Planctomycetota bacterium]